MTRVASFVVVQMAYIRCLRGQGAAEGALELRARARLRALGEADGEWVRLNLSSLEEGEVVALQQTLGEVHPGLAAQVQLTLDVELTEADLATDGGFDVARQTVTLTVPKSGLQQRMFTVELPEQPAPPGARRSAGAAQIELSVLVEERWPAPLPRSVPKG